MSTGLTLIVAGLALAMVRGADTVQPGKLSALRTAAAKNGPAEHLPEPQTGNSQETSPCQITFWDDGIEGMSKIKNPL